MIQKSSSLTTKDNLPGEGDRYHFYTVADANEPSMTLWMMERIFSP